MATVSSLATVRHNTVPFTVADVARLEEVSDLAFAPNSKHMVYVLTKAGADDAKHSQLWSADVASGAAQQIGHHGPFSDSRPLFSRDDQRLFFMRESHKTNETQLWFLCPSSRSCRIGEHQVTHIPGGISDYSLSPDGKNAVVVAEAGRAVGSKPKIEPPIIIDRFQFKADNRGWLDDRRQQLFLVNIASGRKRQITSGTYDHWDPNYSPDGKWISFVSKRCANVDQHICSDVYIMPASGGVVQLISKTASVHNDPAWEAGAPQWSPDSRKLVWLQSDNEKFTWYAPFQLAITDIYSGTTTTPAHIDRWFYKPHWSTDGKNILTLVEQDMDIVLAKVDAASGALTYLTAGKRFGYDFAESAEGQLVIADSTPNTAVTLRSLGGGGHNIGHHNQWLANKQISDSTDIVFNSSGVDIHGQLLLPPNHQAGEQHPLIVRLHGGPVSMDGHELMIDWQIYAAKGYAVLSINPRGSSGRGADFARAQMAKWGTVDVDDIKAGIDHVIAMGVVDKDRVGVGGWSYGGILSNYMITCDPRIKAAVSGAGMGNFFGGYGTDQYARDYELELGRPWENPDLWRKLSYPFFEVGRITAPTLYMCAELDNNVPCIGAEQMYQALRSRGVPTGLIVYPGETHGLVVPSHIRDRLQRHLDWYDRYLKVQP